MVPLVRETTSKCTTLRSPVTDLFDERDRMIRGTASRRTLDLIGVVAAIGSLAAVVYFAVVAPGTSWPPWLFWLAVYTFGLYVVYGVVRLYTRYER